MIAMNLQVVAEIDLKSKIGQCRAAPVKLADGRKAVIAVWGGDFDVDPYVEMFFFPTDTLKLTLFTVDGEVLWHRDLGKGVVPGMWFCPVLPFDLDGDGSDEIWFVNNTDPQHPLARSSYVLERVDPLTGETTGQWPWPRTIHGETLSHTFRNFIMGGCVHGKPVLVTAQGTYGDMHLQGRGLTADGELEEAWFNHIRSDTPGARGSHMCPVVDIDRDGSDELMWGERCIRLDDGTEMFCCDRDSYKGHSDVVSPVWLADQQRWVLYTCREGDPKASPRVALYDEKGERLWGHVDAGHIDMGWAARLAPTGRLVASAIRIGKKTCGPDGRFHQDMTEFAFDLLTGEEIDLGFSAYRTLPVDLNGDGMHELVCGRASGGGEVLDAEGRVVASLGGATAMCSKFTDLPGEQILSYGADGKLKIWADLNAVDSEAARRRYANPFYAANQRLTSSGSNGAVLGGL